MIIADVLKLLNAVPKGEKIWGVGLSDYGSDRGSYEDSYVGYSVNKFVQVEDLITFIQTKIVGNSFCGYKGGLFVMDEYSELHLGEYGSGGYPIDGILLELVGQDVRYSLKPLKTLLY